MSDDSNLPVLYQYPPSGNCYKIRLLLHRLEIPYRRVSVDITRGESRTPAFLARNPQGKIPLMSLADGRQLAESHAVMWYFSRDTELLPEGRFEQAEVLRWMCFEQYQLEPFLGGLRYRLRSLGMSPEQIGADYRRLYDGAEAGLKVLNHHLESHSFMATGQVTIADIALYAYTHQAHEVGFDWADYPAISRWMKQVESQPRHIDISC